MIPSVSILGDFVLNTEIQYFEKMAMSIRQLNMSLLSRSVSILFIVVIDHYSLMLIENDRSER